MRGSIGGIFRISVVSLLLLLAGCTEADKTLADKSSDSGMGMTAGVPADFKQSDGSGNFNVAILPEEPTAGDELRIVFSGIRKMDFCIWERNGERVETSDCSVLPKHSFVKGDEVRVRVSAEGKDASAGVTIANASPEVVTVPFKEAHIHRGVDIEVMPEGVDIDGDFVFFHYVWTINGEELSLDSPMLPGDRFYKGDRISLNVIPYDAEAEGRVYRGREFIVPNAPPDFSSIPPMQFRSGVYQYHATAEDADGDVIHFSLESAPAGMTIEGDTGLIVWPVGKDQVGEHQITIVAEDEQGARAFQSYAVSISLGEK